MTIAYYVDNKIYLNITNRCSAQCDFCLRRKNDGYGGSSSLWLNREPETKEILNTLFALDWKHAPEIVFCGFGEPMMRYETVFEVAGAIKKESPSKQLRLNTNGHGNMIAGRDITPQLKGIFDTVSVSLNYPDESDYIRHCRPMYPAKAYGSMLEFVQGAAENVQNVILTVTSQLTQPEIDAARDIAKSLGVKLRVREMI